MISQKPCTRAGQVVLWIQNLDADNLVIIIFVHNDLRCYLELAHRLTFAEGNVQSVCLVVVLIVRGPVIGEQL